MSAPSPSPAPPSPLFGVSVAAANDRRAAHPVLTVQTSSLRAARPTAAASADDSSQLTLQASPRQPLLESLPITHDEHAATTSPPKTSSSSVSHPPPHPLGHTAPLRTSSSFSLRSRSRSLSFDSPTSATYYRDLTPLPSPVVSTSPNFRQFYSGKSPPSISSSALAAAQRIVSRTIPSPRYITEITRGSLDEESESSSSELSEQPSTVVVPPARSRPKKNYGDLSDHVGTEPAARIVSPTPAPPPLPLMPHADSSTADAAHGLGISTLRTSITPPSPNAKLEQRQQQPVLDFAAPGHLVLPTVAASAAAAAVSRRSGGGDPMQREVTHGKGSDGPGEIFEAYDDKSLRKLRWKEVRPLGQGTFSRVVLASLVDESEAQYSSSAAVKSAHQRLVAIKIVQLASAGGASRERIESSLNREVDILKNLEHPCLIHLVALNINLERALIVIPFCPGGDLFDLATSPERGSILQPRVVRRLFAEIVSAVLYLHAENIVHRDIKLENVLLNVEPAKIPASIYGSRSITTLTDFGLSRRIDPANPMLTTRCGSEDYAPPELIMGQPYDGREMDAWALCVLLYTLLEGRFPFDAAPPIVFAPDGSLVTPTGGAGGSRRSSARGRVKHRIARIEWSWILLQSADGAAAVDSDSDDGGSGVSLRDSNVNVALADPDSYVGAKKIVEMGLRRREARCTVRQIAESAWLRGAFNAAKEV
ncbi:kinase-like domain-containing protein [Limtongia smithiae]|uniref:kinase-like domain-containing protein n=1 Tax=Limtongia smithiae TaxID=1125753 RepID=UPI0034CF9DB3